MTALDPAYVLGAVIALLLMVHAGVGKRRLAWRETRCAVCGRPLSSCTCRWL